MNKDTRFWDRNAEAYSRRAVADPEAFDRKIAVTTGLMTDVDVVLDIGCGTGSLALRLAPYGEHVHGLDLSSEMVRIARSKATAAQISNVTFHTGTLDSALEFEPESLSLICASSILHLLEDRPKALERVYELLRPGGYFVSSTPCLGGSWFYRPLLGAMHALGLAPRVWLFTQNALEQEIARAGFTDLRSPDVGAEATIAFLVTKKPG